MEIKKINSKEIGRGLVVGLLIGVFAIFFLLFTQQEKCSIKRVKRSDALTIWISFIENAKIENNVPVSTIYSEVLSKQRIIENYNNKNEADKIIDILSGYFVLNDEGSFSACDNQPVKMTITCWNLENGSIVFEVIGESRISPIVYRFNYSNY